MEEKQSVYVMPENVSRTLGRDAQRNNILAAKIVAEILKTTLGPKGMDKMLVDSAGNIIVTNDGATILEEMEFDHPAAKMIVEIAKTQESEVGDGTTTVAVLAGKLLEQAEKLLDKKIHPTLIVKGYGIAAKQAISILEQISLPIDNKELLKNIAITAMTGKGAEGNKEKFASLIIDAVDRVSLNNKINLNSIKIQKIKGENSSGSELINGLIIDKGRAHDAMPSSIESAKILLIDVPLEIKNPEMETKIEISSPEQLESFLASEEKTLKTLTDNIIYSGTKVVFCQKGIDDVAQYYLAKAGIMAVRRVSRSDMELLAKSTSGKIISNLRDVISPSNFGFAGRVREEKKGDDSLIYVEECKDPMAVTLVIKGGTTQSLDEIERAIKDGLGDVVSALSNKRVVAGGGAVEIELARRLRTFANMAGGREQLAIDAFASALESIPEALAENAGLDPLDVITELRKRHEGGAVRDGLNLLKDKIEDTFNAGIVEPLKVKTQAISAANEFVSMILRIDDVLISKDTEKKKLTQSYDTLD